MFSLPRHLKGKKRRKEEEFITADGWDLNERKGRIFCFCRQRLERRIWTYIDSKTVFVCKCLKKVGTKKNIETIITATLDTIHILRQVHCESHWREDNNVWSSMVCLFQKTLCAFVDCPMLTMTVEGIQAKADKPPLETTEQGMEIRVKMPHNEEQLLRSIYLHSRQWAAKSFPILEIFPSPLKHCFACCLCHDCHTQALLRQSHRHQKHDVTGPDHFHCKIQTAMPCPLS